MSQRPLCVDLDGTLIRVDSLVESLLKLVSVNALYLFLIPFWLLRGKSNLKEQLARRTIPEPSLLPYNQAVVDFLVKERNLGTIIVLATAAHSQIANAVAAHLKLFDQVLSTEGGLNLKGRNKASKLTELFGVKGFDYIGDSSADIPVWQSAKNAFVISPNKMLKRELLRHVGKFSTIAAQNRSLPGRLVSIMRMHQWVKNLLILAPVLASHTVLDASQLTKAVLGVLAFCLASSCVYIVNDLFDLESDRRHAAKKNRMIASGYVSATNAVALLACLSVASLLIVKLSLNNDFLFVLLSYVVISLLYTFYLKKQLVVDMVALAGLYTIRIVAGAAALGIPLSFWLLGFAVFLFYGLAVLKRVIELKKSMDIENTPLAGRAYVGTDYPLLVSQGAASGIVATLVLALYINSEQVVFLYSRPEYLWGLCPLLLYWLSRIWLLANRGELHHDPVYHAITDKATYIVALIGAVFIYLAANG